MYVFFDAGQARRFQNGEDPAKLKYNLDFSTLGTQSCNGRIPTNGHSTIYMGFENERVRYNNYVWLEAIAAISKTEYSRPRYRIKGDPLPCPQGPSPKPLRNPPPPCMEGRFLKEL